MKITLKIDKFIRGILTDADTTVDVGDLVGQSLIDDGSATKFSAKPKKTSKRNRYMQLSSSPRGSRACLRLDYSGLRKK